jgi:hypothetical protein
MAASASPKPPPELPPGNDFDRDAIRRQEAAKVDPLLFATPVKELAEADIQERNPLVWKELDAF